MDHVKREFPGEPSAHRQWYCGSRPTQSAVLRYVVLRSVARRTPTLSLPPRRDAGRPAANCGTPHHEAQKVQIWKTTTSQKNMLDSILHSSEFSADGWRLYPRVLRELRTEWCGACDVSMFVRHRADRTSKLDGAAGTRGHLDILGGETLHPFQGLAASPLRTCSSLLRSCCLSSRALLPPRRP